MAKPVFSQMRSLARELDTGVTQLKKTILEEPTSAERCERNQTAALREMSHRLQEAKQLKVKVQATSQDFHLKNQSFSHMMDLVQKVVRVQQGRLEAVESHMEKYGYTRMELPASEDTAAGSNDEPAVQAASSDDLTTDGCTELDSCIVDLPEVDRSTDCAPKLPSLSRETLMLLKKGGQNAGGSKEESKKFFETPDINTPDLGSSALRSRETKTEQNGHVSTCVRSDLTDKFFDTPDFLKLESNSSALFPPKPPVLLSSAFTEQTTHLNDDTYEAFQRPADTYYDTSEAPLMPVLTSRFTTRHDNHLKIKTADSNNTINNKENTPSAMLNKQSGDTFVDMPDASTPISTAPIMPVLTSRWATDRHGDSSQNKESANDKETQSRTRPLSDPEPPVLLTQNLMQQSGQFARTNGTPVPQLKSEVACGYEAPSRPALHSRPTADINVPPMPDSVSADHNARDGPKKSVTSISPPKPPKLLGSYSFFNK